MKNEIILRLKLGIDENILTSVIVIVIKMVFRVQSHWKRQLRSITGEVLLNPFLKMSKITCSQ